MASDPTDSPGCLLDIVCAYDIIDRTRATESPRTVDISILGIGFLFQLMTLITGSLIKIWSSFVGGCVMLLNMLFHATRTCKGVGQDVILKYGQCNSDTSCYGKKEKWEGLNNIYKERFHAHHLNDNMQFLFLMGGTDKRNIPPSVQIL